MIILVIAVAAWLRRRRAVRAAAAVSALAVAATLAACSTTARPAAPVARVDWTGDYTVAVADAWELTPCEGGPGLMCIRRDDETRGTAELLTYPVRSFDAVASVLDAGGDHRAALAAVAADFHDVFIEDRPIGCGEGYRVEPFGPSPSEVGGLPGVVYGFTGFADGRPVERALQFAAIERDVLHLIATTAVEGGACMDDPELAQLTIDDLEGLEPELVVAVAASRLPDAVSP